MTEKSGVLPSPERKKMPIEAAFNNLVALSRAVQADKRAHEVIEESLAVVREACGL